MNNKKVEKKIQTTTEGFYCLSCKKYFSRMDGFKYHMKLKNQPISRNRPRTKGCTNINNISWITVQENAKKQIEHFKLPNAVKRKQHKTKYMYMNKLTTEDILKARKSNVNSITTLFLKYKGWDFSNKKDKQVIKLYLEKQVTLGYEIIKVRHQYRSNDEIMGSGRTAKHYYYLVKDNIIYLPFKTQHRELIKVGKIEDINYTIEDIKFSMLTDPILYTRIYKGKTEQEAYRLNYGKISRELIHKGNIENGFTLKIKCKENTTLQLKQYVIEPYTCMINGLEKIYGFYKKTFVKKYQEKKKLFDVEIKTQIYYSHTYQQNTEAFAENEFPLNEKILVSI